MKTLLLRIWILFVNIWNFFVGIYHHLTIKRLSIQDVIGMTSNGKVFSANFIKKDGTIRTMNCRTGVVKHLKGGTLAFDPISKNLLPVFDMGVEDYRFINFNTLNWINVGGKKYTNFNNK